MADRNHDAQPPAPLLGVGEVMVRYALRDRRAARRVMDQAGAFLIGGRLHVRAADLLAHEERLQALRHAEHAPAEEGQRTAPRARSRPSASRPEPLPPGWWREPGP